MSFKVVQNIFQSSIEVKKSKFISTLMPYSKFQEQMKLLREDHPKARHFVYAYRFLNEHQQIVENLSDDGEPKGSSGKPTLSPLQGSGLINSAIITVRYFGGTKLGVGGLVRAYSKSANSAIQLAELYPYISLEQVTLKVDFRFLSKCEHILRQYNVEDLKKDFSSESGESVSLSFCLSESEVKKLKLEFSQHKGILEFSC